MPRQKITISLVLLSLASLFALIVFLLEWSYSPLNKALAWYHLKVGGFVNVQEAAKYTEVLLEGKPYSQDKQYKFPYLAVSEQTTMTIKTPKSFLNVTVEDAHFLLEARYTYPKGQLGYYDLDYRTLFVEGRTAAMYTVVGQTYNEPVNQITFVGKKAAEELKTEILAQWKLVVTSLGKKEAKPTEELTSFAEVNNFTKIVKLSDLSYRLAPTPSVAFEVGAETETTIHIGSLTLKQKDCSISAKIDIVYRKATQSYLFDNAYTALASMCTKPKPKPTSGVLSCKNCWLAPVSKQFSLLSTYSPYVVSTGLNGGGYVTPDTKTALKKLFEAAKKESISSIRVSSSFRSFSTQNDLFNTYVNNEKKAGLSTTQAVEKANTYSAKPGHSEHQLGTTVDLVACAYPCSFYNSANTPLFTFLKNNAHTFGFIISYPNGSQPYTGYVYEPWHLRYVGEVYAKELYDRGYLTKKGFYLYQFLLEKGKY